ncbi:hypothetical protein [Rhizobium lusitanum]|uniref:hypothetical protein n=1 Tax=Rhizobium lusitanum TaxID=293958 RepID=UPI001FD48076|nr:hypothetical protein [Rhizobium lusitanum]
MAEDWSLNVPLLYHIPMISDRFFKTIAWTYIAALIAVTFAHLNWQAAFGNPFDLFRAGALCVAGMLARLAYPQSPSFTCLLMIGSVLALWLSHFLASGDSGSSLDIIIGMISGLWGIMIGAALSKLISPASKRTVSY